jgi:Flp pilus assembly protein TadB
VIHRIELEAPRTVRDSIREVEEVARRQQARRVLSRWYVKAAAILVSFMMASHNADLGSLVHVALFLIGAAGLLLALLWALPPLRQPRRFYQGRGC